MNKYEYHVHQNNKFFVKVPYTTALEFAQYFIKHGIPAKYICREKGYGWRELAFDDDTENVDIMLAWIESWNGNHKRCPFCDSIASIHTDGDDVHVRCIKCGCMTKSVSKWHDDCYVWEFWDERITER